MPRSGSGWRRGLTGAYAATGAPCCTSPGGSPLDRVREPADERGQLHANPVEPADEAWLKTAVPQAEVIVWPVEHHFPHLADPDGFADLLERVAESAASRPELRSATG